MLPPQPLDALPSDICGVDGTAKGECVRTVPPRENGGNTDTKETVVGTTLLFPCFIDGCGLFAGDVHFAMGGGEVAGTAIEMAATVTLQAKVIPGGGSQLSTMHVEGGSQLKSSPRRVSMRSRGFRLSPKARCQCFPPTLIVRDNCARQPL